MSATESEPGEAAPPSGKARRYAFYVLVMLLLVNVFNYLDRGILGILQEPIKRDLRLTDFQLGMISGPAFALMYSIAGIPIARVAERGDRSIILSTALALWSGMTALCGLATSYVHLALCRVGVGMGEGASLPTSHSLISEYFPPRQRGMAMSVFGMGIPVAGFFAPMLGGFIAATLGWRAAFMIVGLPGVVLALVLGLTLKDPRREAKKRGEVAPPAGKFLTDLKWLFSQRPFVFLFIGSAFFGQAISGTNFFTASFFIRQYGLSVAQAGIVSSIGLGLAGLVGTVLGGYFSDRFAGKYGRSYFLIPGIGAGLAGALFLITFSRDTWPVAMAFLILANVATDLKNGPNMAAPQQIAPANMRATASALTMFGVTVCGTALGPIILGAISDAVAGANFSVSLGQFADACPGGRPVAGAAESLKAACATASAAGMRAGLMVISAIYFAAMTFFFLAAWSKREALTAG